MIRAYVFCKGFVFHFSKFGLGTITRGQDDANNLPLFSVAGDERILSIQPSQSPKQDVILITAKRKRQRINLLDMFHIDSMLKEWTPVINLSSDDHIVSAGCHGPLYNKNKN